jgi:protocatechuate 3,4-dioxygenase beta subunit
MSNTTPPPAIPAAEESAAISNEAQRASGRGPGQWSRSGFFRLGATVAAPLLVAAEGARRAAGGLAAPWRDQEEAGNPAPVPENDQAGEAGETAAAGADTLLPLTPASRDGSNLALTPAQTEGPYFKRNSPERASLVDAGTAGTRLTLSGRVLDQRGRPVARALLDFWQADARGAYDNTGYLLRGHQFADEAGQYRLEAVVPGLYPGRTRHVHVKVQAPNGPVLTTQLYFPGEARNAADRIFDPSLVLPLQSAAGGQVATFDFVIRI